MIIKKVLQLVLSFSTLMYVVNPNIGFCNDAAEINVSAPLYTDSAGFVGQKAAASVFRILCPTKGKIGTGFLHQSGAIITAAHVVENCEPSNVVIILPNGDKIPLKAIVSDEDFDIAALIPVKKINGDTLPITNNNNIIIGAQVSTWGFPAGYNGMYPMLSVGYLSGLDRIKTPSGKLVERLVVNAAFNTGNSGGPLIDVGSGVVISVVSSKLAPIPPEIEMGLKALRKTEIGVGWTSTKPDETKGSLSQAQLLEIILQYMRSQTQLVVGYAVPPNQLIKFLESNRLNKIN